MAVVTTFLVNLLCSVVSCDVALPHPEIGDDLLSGGGVVGAASSIYSRTTQHEPNPFVQTKYGGLEGYIMKTSGNRRIFAFEGIPYVQPFVGTSRFQKATPLRPWNGIRQAKKSGPDCLQLSLPKMLRVVGNEDCLYLNIYTPKIPFPDADGRLEVGTRSKLPVIMSIHGGGYFYGSGNDLGPSYLLNKQVVHVTFNYRLGVLGFLSTGDHHSPGNYGLHDQSMAIQWIYENIHHFGGDSNRITIIGHNSGAACAQLHLLSNKSSSYISSGVSLSGSAFTHWAIKSRKESWRLATTLAKHINCPFNESGEMMKCLRNKNPVELVGAQYSLLEFSPFPVTLFSPVIEAPSSEAFLTQTPSVAYAKNEVERKPWIFGTVAQEGYLGLLLLKTAISEGTLRSRWEQLAPIYLDYKYTAKNVSQTTAKLSKFYFGHKSPRTVSENKLAAIFGDRFMLPGVNKAIQLHSNIAPTFAYIFGFKGKYTLGRMVGRKSTDWGVGHSEDLFYYFNSSSFSPGFKKVDQEELAVSNVMTTFLANFAATGEPLLPQESNVLTDIWQQVDPQNVEFLQLNQRIKMIPQPFKKRLHFWDRLGRYDPTLLDPLFDNV